jgi:hypothetical protein
MGQTLFSPIHCYHQLHVSSITESRHCSVAPTCGSNRLSAQSSIHHMPGGVPATYKNSLTLTRRRERCVCVGMSGCGGREWDAHTAVYSASLCDTSERESTSQWIGVVCAKPMRDAVVLYMAMWPHAGTMLWRSVQCRVQHIMQGETASGPACRRRDFSSEGMDGSLSKRGRTAPTIRALTH